MRLALKLVLLSATSIAFPLSLLAAPRHIKVQQLPANTRELYETSMKLAAESFDSEKHLIQRPSQSHSNSRGFLLVRESSWYALGLLARDQPGDRALAAAILEAVLNEQYTHPRQEVVRHLQANTRGARARARAPSPSPAMTQTGVTSSAPPSR